MKIGINVNCIDFSDVDRNLRLLVENGFEKTFLPSDDQRLDEFFNAIKKYPLTTETLHGPFLSDKECGINDIWKHGEKGELMLSRMIDAAEKCARHNVPYLITHLSSGTDAPQVSETGLERIDRLIRRAEHIGVTIAFENLRKIGNLACALEYFPQSAFCLDVGHQYCYAEGKQFLPLFGDRLATLHIHDNLAVINEDLHILPFDGSIDYRPFVNGLKDWGYSGTLMLEVFKTYHRKYGKNYYSDLSDEEYVKRAANAVRRLQSML